MLKYKLIEGLKNKTLERDINDGNFDFSSCEIGTIGGNSIEYHDEETNSVTSYLYKNKEDLDHDFFKLIEVWR